jgi:hypothetical protein
MKKDWRKIGEARLHAVCTVFADEVLRMIAISMASLQ